MRKKQQVQIPAGNGRKNQDVLYNMECKEGKNKTAVATKHPHDNLSWAI